MRATVAAHVLAFAPACLQLDTQPECLGDDECEGACTRTQECALGTLVDVTVTWRIHGLTPTPDNPGACLGVDHLALTFEDSNDYAGGVMYEPIPCELGITTYDKMPPRFDSIGLSAQSSSGRILDSAQQRLQPGENIIEFSLFP